MVRTKKRGRRKKRSGANRTLVMTGWMHHGLGNTLSQIVDFVTIANGGVDCIATKPRLPVAN
jgi:hypothetical protein